ncbi:hypothetical protein SERLA73DRAFT_162112 [Serpula lacrymans var. lacrymans S7.3]|uniref:Uncharacterized protein n=2 Tax=Serpula lacrymans var. lacrymans TaxID=341189 RepID=F8Q6I8_SERL3|nr:uncharacterized protein SERLADRAFT_474613 [Serpula lacrymans var. lacrymans S7.9]EGN96226.1 hypothetical protein SERLA73DRAFT_162112 [Serpula lacrymans var. lacrymans S7.3]EGO21763.1 hypothetical protein SERLADRAFT_474613 [Serpula lacrymans var. lacrymans S7.9]
MAREGSTLPVLSTVRFAREEESGAQSMLAPALTQAVRHVAQRIQDHANTEGVQLDMTPTRIGM